ncbi:MAG: glycosyltransferase family 87 protein [Anaerolineae bacterium]|nr:glycosyltransferase family 87 protein [Anaerolineae bacterium]
MPKPTQSTRFRAKAYAPWLLLALLLAGLIAAESVAVYTVFTSRFPSGNDFFVRWLGGREYLLNGTNPYDRSVAEAAQQAMFGRLAQPEDKDQAYFAYPLYTLYFFWPLSLMGYAKAQAVWMTLLQFMLLGSTGLALWLSGWRPPKWLLIAGLLWGILFYNGARAILLGQFSILVGLALFLGLWAIERRYDSWAGVFLSVTTIKPQMVFLVLLFLFVWLLLQGRWRVIGSFAASMAALVLSSMLLVPTWPFDFIRNAVEYSDYVAFGTPLENLLHYFLRPGLAAPLTVWLSLLFFMALLPGWWLAFRGRPGAYTWAIHATLIVGSLITFRSATTNQVILYLPIFFFLYRLAHIRVPAGLMAAGLFGLMMFMWGVFGATLDGNWEAVMMHGLLPALLLLLFALDWRALWAAAVRYEAQIPGPETRRRASSPARAEGTV